MELSSQRKIIAVNPSWSLDEITTHLTSALAGVGPALAFSQADYQVVDQNCAVVVTTTGSSGVKKDVALSATALISNARASLAYLDAVPGQRWSLLLPLQHVAGINVLVRSLELGTSPIDLRLSRSFINVDYTAIVPTQLHSALSGDDALLDHLRNAKAVLVGGAALDRHLADQAKAAGITIITTYGATETAGGCVYNGEPLAGVTIDIKNEIISISGKTLASGYLNHPELWEDTSVFHTQDRGEILDGKLIVKGRADDVIISGGANISLHQVESLLRDNFPQTQVVALGLADEHWGQALHIAHVGDLDVALATQLLAENLGSSAKPKGFHRVDQIPLIGIGKIDRKALEGLIR